MKRGLVSLPTGRNGKILAPDTPLKEAVSKDPSFVIRCKGACGRKGTHVRIAGQGKGTPGFRLELDGNPQKYNPVLETCHSCKYKV